MKKLLALFVAIPLIAWADPDLAAEKEATPPPAPAPAPKKKPAPYTLPFHLRPIAASNVVRLDNVLAIYNATDGVVKAAAATGGALKGMKEVSILNAGYTFAKDFGILARIGVSNHLPNKDHPATGAAAPSHLDANGRLKNSVALTNGLLFFTYTPSFLDGDLRTAFYLGATAPIGSGGGNNGDLAARNANAANMMTRSAMDNALFAVNDVAIIPGVDIAYVKYGLTVQLEVTYLEIMRVRGEGGPIPQSDVVKRNLVAGLFVGYSIIPQLAVGAELRYQRWLKEPHAIRNAAEEVKDKRMQNMAVALGLRGNFKIGEKTFFRPAISYAMGVMGEIADSKYHLIQLDLPFAL